MKNKGIHINIVNRKARYEYFILEELTAGIVLLGTEIKSIRAGKANLADSYCMFFGNELFVVGMHVSEYKNASFRQHQPKRNRKLLLTKRELKRFREKTQEKGLTIIPISLYVNKKGLAKLVIGLAKGKHTYDKKESIKEKDSKRDLENSLKY